MKLLKKLCNGIDVVNDWIGRGVAFGVLIILGVIIYEVVVRRVFQSPQLWTMDMICMTFGCYVILICALGFQKKAFVAVDVLYARLSPVKQHMLHIFTYLFFMAPFLGALLPETFVFFYRSLLSGEKGYSVWAPYIWPVKLAMAVGFLLLCLQGISEIGKHIIWVADYYKGGRKLPSADYMKEGL